MASPDNVVINHILFICNLACAIFVWSIAYNHCTNLQINTRNMRKQIDHVAKFHETFGIGNEEHPNAEVGTETALLRYTLMREENEEYLEAARNGDLVEIADALGDMMYILCGTILKHGLQDIIEDVFEEIQRSNMSKLDENGKPIYREDGKVLKGKNYFKPDIKGIISKHLSK